MQQTMIARALVVGLMSLILSLPGESQPGWQLKKDKDGIRVFNRDDPHSRFNELKVETILPARLSSLAALLLDIGNYPKWSFNTQQAYVLKAVGPSELYFYSLIHSPWPATDRDLVVHLRISQDAATKVMIVLADGVPNFIPAKKDLVRVPLSTEKWTVTPLPGDRIRVDYQLEIDPGGSVPPVLINSFSTKGPFETFTHLREQLRLPKYRTAIISFIKE